MRSPKLNILTQSAKDKIFNELVAINEGNHDRAKETFFSFKVEEARELMHWLLAKAVFCSIDEPSKVEAYKVLLDDCINWGVCGK